MTVITIPGGSYTEDDAFCTKQDVEGFCARGKFTDATKPSHQQVLDWMGFAAAEIENALATGGFLYTVTSRGNPFPASTSDPKVARLKTLCRSANILAAAARVIEIHSIKDEDGTSPTAAAKQKEYEALLEVIEGAVNVALTPMPTFSTSDAEGLKFRSDTEF